MTAGAEAAGGADGQVVACVGETMAALVPAAAQPLETADTLRVDVAGAESNVATYLADHGIAARWVSRLGDDAFGRRVARAVADAGVDISGVRFDPDRPTGLLFKDPGPEGTRVTYYRRGSAASAMDPRVLDDEALRTATVWHFSGVTPALSPDCLALVRAALATPRPGRVTVAFDVNYRPALWTEPPGKLLQDLADRADIAFVGLDEARALWGADVHTAADVRALLPSPRILVVKDGATAATAFDDDRETTVPSRRVAVVEPVGAGDAFGAGFLAALLRGHDMQRRLRLGHLTAASALSVTGDRGPLPPPAEQQRLLAATATEWLNS